jgi:acetolactate synthase I/II/III large subunit
MQKSDLLINLGARFDDRITGKVSDVRPRGQDHPRRHRPGRAGQGPPSRRPDRRRLPARHRELIKAIRDLLEGGVVQADTHRVEESRLGWREQFPLTYEQSEPGSALKPQFCLEKLRDAAPEGTILVSGVGQHQMWSSQYWKFEQPYTWVNSGGLGTMGFSIPLRSAPRSVAPTARCGRSTATAASR